MQPVAVLRLHLPLGLQCTCNQSLATLCWLMHHSRYRGVQLLVDKERDAHLPEPCCAPSGALQRSACQPALPGKCCYPIPVILVALERPAGTDSSRLTSKDRGTVVDERSAWLRKETSATTATSVVTYLPAGIHPGEGASQSAAQPIPSGLRTVGVIRS